LVAEQHPEVAVGTLWSRAMSRVASDQIGPMGLRGRPSLLYPGFPLKISV
jgi:hypothetical protein